MSTLLDNATLNSSTSKLDLENINLEGQLDAASPPSNKELTGSSSYSKNQLSNKMASAAANSDQANNMAASAAGAAAAGVFSSVTANFNINAFKPHEWISKKRETLKPWGEFMNMSKFKKPASPGQFGLRLVKNVNHFQSNYLFVFVFLAVYCVLTSPYLLFVFMAFVGGCYILYLKNKDGNLKLFGRDLSLAQLYSVAGVFSVPLFLIAGAGSAVFWIIGASIFVIILHAAFYSREEQEDPFLVQMNIV